MHANLCMRITKDTLKIRKNKPNVALKRCLVYTLTKFHEAPLSIARTFPCTNLHAKFLSPFIYILAILPGYRPAASIADLIFRGFAGLSPGIRLYGFLKFSEMMPIDSQPF